MEDKMKKFDLIGMLKDPNRKDELDNLIMNSLAAGGMTKAVQPLVGMVARGAGSRSLAKPTTSLMEALDNEIWNYAKNLVPDNFGASLARFGNRIFEKGVNQANPTIEALGTQLENRGLRTLTEAR